MVVQMYDTLGKLVRNELGLAALEIVGLAGHVAQHLLQVQVDRQGVPRSLIPVLQHNLAAAINGANHLIQYTRGED